MRVAEEFAYLDCAGEQLYVVVHPAARAVGRVVLAGPFASERPHAYSAWVRWARFLARDGFEVIRFDYRGVGESTGRFEDMSFHEWAADLRFVLAHARERATGQLPLAIHGLGLGGLLAADAFAAGLGNALLLWAAPSSGRDVLREGLMRRMSIDFVLQSRGRRKTADEYVAMLEAGEIIEVEGYPWGARLWRGAGLLDLAGSLGSNDPAGTVAGRPWRNVPLDGAKVPLVSGLGSWQAMNPRAIVRRFPLDPDLGAFFRENATWMRRSLGIGGAP